MKKIWKQAGTALLAAAMAALMLAGCGGNGNSGSTSSAAGKTETNSETSTAASPDDGEIVKLRVWGYGDAKTEDCEEVAEAVSKITREKIGVEVELVRSIDGEKLNLALTSGEKLDLASFHTYSGGLPGLVSVGLAMPLDNLLKEYGQDMLKLIDPADLKCDAIGGVQYSVPSLKDTARGSGIAMRKDILDELKIDPETIKTYEDIHDVLVKVKESHSELYPLVPSWSGGGMQDVFMQDELGGSFGVLEDASKDSTQVVNLYETDTYREFAERMYQWNQEGLIMPDATTTTENNLLGSVGFADWENIKPGKKQEIEKNMGAEAVLVELNPALKKTGISGSSSFFIPSACEYPEKAMQLWSLMFTDPEISNLFINGIEGKHYVYTDDSKTVIATPEGVSTTGSGYASNDWAWPNCRITPVWEGCDPDQWKQLQEFSDTAIKSPALGFYFDPSTVMNETTACNNVVTKYDNGLRWGVLNPDEALPKMIEELKAAGVDTIIAEKQAQLDKWLAENQ